MCVQTNKNQLKMDKKKIEIIGSGIVGQILAGGFEKYGFDVKIATRTASKLEEKMFDGIDGLNTLHLLPTYFMENTLGMTGLIKQAGIMGAPLKGDLSLAVIATKDIAAYAAKRLLSLSFEGNNIQDLLGARDVAYNEMAKVYGAAIGKPDLQYVEFSYEDVKKSFIEQRGASESIADNMNEFIKAVNEGKVTDGIRGAESTTPTTIEDFAETFAYVYNNN